MPTVPTEQNRVGIAGLTGEKLQTGDYSGTGLQALGTGLETLGAAGRKVAVEQQARQDADDDYAIKAAWNDYAEQARTIRAAPPPDLDPEDAFNVTAQAYTDALGLARARLKNERQQEGFAHVIGPRFDADISSARAAADLGLAAGRAEQDELIQRNARQDAIDHFRQPEIFAKYLATGAEAVRLQSMRRGDDPAMTAGLETAYRSGVHRGVIEALEQDPVAAATYYMRERAGMTARDRAAIESSLQEPLAWALAARDVDRFLPTRAPGEADTPLTPGERATAAQKIEAADWAEARKSRAREDLTRRGLGENQRRKQTASAAKAAALDTIEPLGLGFKSLTQLPGAIRRDLDEDTATALARQAERNLDPAPVAPGGRTSLVMNLMATQNPEAFAREDLRLVQDLVTPDEQNRFVRLQQGMNHYPPHGDAITNRRALEATRQPWLGSGLEPSGTTLGFRDGDSTGTGKDNSARFIKVSQDGGAFNQDRAIALNEARRTGRDPTNIYNSLHGSPTAESATLSPLHKQLKNVAANYPPEKGTLEWTLGWQARWKIGGDSIFEFKDQWVRGYRRAIVAAARKFDLPAELVAGVAYNEVGGDPLWMDSLAYNLRIGSKQDKTSFGNMSLQIRRAAQTLNYKTLGGGEKAAIIASLTDSQTSIFIAAKHLADLRDIDFKGTRSSKLTKDQIEVIATRYNAGPDLPLIKIRIRSSYGAVIIRRWDHLADLVRDTRKTK